MTVDPPQYPPIVLNCSSNITVTASNYDSSGTVVFYSVSASGGCSAPTVYGYPASGASFQIGTTTVNVTAYDSCGNSTNCSFMVTVNPPSYPPITVNCPSNITVTATGPGGAVVFYTVTASGGCSPPTINSVPPSGSTFPIGTTTVNSMASDTCGNSATCSFTVTVVIRRTAPLVTGVFLRRQPLLPPNGSVYISPAQWHVLFAQRHRHPGRAAPVLHAELSVAAAGDSQTENFSSEAGL